MSYYNEFWKRVSNKTIESMEEGKGNGVYGNEHLIPEESAKAINDAVTRFSVMRKLCTIFPGRSTSDRIMKLNDSDDICGWFEEGDVILPDSVEDLMQHSEVDSSRFLIEKEIFTVSNDLMADQGEQIEKFIIRKAAKKIARNEDNAYINGDGTKEPYGLLHATKGATIGFTTSELNYTAIVNLFFSLEPEYRDYSAWVMNDKTALTLKSITDSTGNPILKDNGMLLGKPVSINNFMPDAISGKSPILIGDYSYYWILDRKQQYLHQLREMYALVDKTGFVYTKFSDAQLSNANAVKRLNIS